MALKDLFALVDDKLKDVFHVREYDPAKDRAKLIKRIEGTKAKFLQTEPVKGKKDFSVANSVVEYHPPIPLEGREVLYVPSERFENLLDHFRASVEAGEVDAALKGTNQAGAGVKAPRAARAPREGGGAGWSPERRAKFEQTLAARKAAKGA